MAGWKRPQGRLEFEAAYEAALGLWPVPYESRLLPTRFGSTHAVVSGPQDAPPLILLPAALGVGAVQWYPNAARLARRFRIHALDFVGAPGKGEQTAPILTRADCAHWLVDVLDALELERGDFVGSSQGGWLALNLAVEAPRRTGDLVLLAPAASFLPMKWGVILTLHLGPLMPAWSAGPAMRATFGGRYQVDELFVQVLAMALKHFRYQEKALYPTVFDADELRGVEARCVLLVGEKEVIYDPRALLDRAVELMSGVRTELVADAGHLLNMEQAELIDSRIVGFLGEGGR